MKVVIIGAGPAGMMAGIIARKKGQEVTIIEKNNEVGKKLNITGKGRCNISFVGDKDYFLENVVTNAKFMMSSFSLFDNKKLVEFVNSLGVKTKEERGNRVFLASDDAHELTIKLKNLLEKLEVKIEYNSPVKELIVNNNKIEGIKLYNNRIINADKVLLATGGNSYKLTGSSGDGYRLAKEVGHNITRIKPALVPFILYENDICKALNGVTLKNVGLTVKEKNIIDKRFGELLFYSKGITGPVVLSSSSKINKIENLDRLLENKEVKVYIDLKPALSNEELYKRITRDFEKYKNKEFKNSLQDLTISSLIPVIIKRSEISENKKVNAITKEEKLKLVSVFKNLEFILKALQNVEAGIVTSGGIDTKEINPKTMESKIVSSLYFAGEVIDVDAYTGGFNLQIAFSTGYCAGVNMG